uniref:Uncharacterized protein n=1 Tax=Knipowitschia caucasica TaxID=637954 RepID=A0AAV2JID6_KNICA
MSFAFGFVWGKPETPLTCFGYEIGIRRSILLVVLVFALSIGALGIYFIDSSDCHGNGKSEEGSERRGGTKMYSGTDPEADCSAGICPATTAASARRHPTAPHTHGVQKRSCDFSISH